MEYDLLGWPDEEVKLALDYRAFSYAGKFVMSNTGKAVAVDPNADADDDEALPAGDREDLLVPDGNVVGAVAFNADRTDPGVWWLRYVTVRDERRGERVGPRLVVFTTGRIRERGADRVKIAVNNPFAYQALYRAGFAFTGAETGIAELVLAYPAEDRSRTTYQDGLDVFRERGLDADERAFLDEKRGVDPPSVVDPSA